MTNRRNFIKISTLAAIGGCFSGLTGNVFGQTSIPDDVFLIPSESIGDPVLTFTSEHFEAFVNTIFQIRQPQMRRSVNLKLIQVKKFESKFNTAEGVTGESYSLLFEAERPVPIEQSIYNFSHAGLGKFSLFISPVSAEPNTYEAVINHSSH